jgi:branched-chain amino acid transport system ATP-binding protein
MLEVEELNVFYGNIRVIWDISFSVRQREIVVLLGSNGSGKTSILKVISGILKPKSGTISFLSKKISDVPAHKRVELGIVLVPEHRMLFSDMTVLENLELGAYTQKAREKFGEDIEMVFQLFPVLKERKKQIAKTLSGGEQQMLAIGRALMSSPKLLLLDEPSLGLAPKLVSSLFDVITKINEEGITVLLVEQNARLSLEIADRGYVLENGRIILSGKAEELLEKENIKKAYLGL